MTPARARGQAVDPADPAGPLAQLTARIAQAPRRTALCLDFDGVLAPIVDDPATSALTEGLAPTLVDLAGRLAALALISGRPASFLADRAGALHAAGARLLGLYGMERWADGGSRAHPDAAGWQTQVSTATEQLARRFAGSKGVTVEDKGLGVAVHWRNAGDERARSEAERAVTAAVREQAARTGLALEPGKLVLELRPPVAWDKGDGVRSVAQDADAQLVIYAGDDLGDLPAFAAVRDLGGTALAVDHGAETDPRVLTAGDVVLHGTDGVARWLHGLCDALRSRSA